MTRDVGDCGDRRALRAHPLPHFSSFGANKALNPNRPLGLPCATLGWPLGHAWATQGPPNPKPNPNPKQAEGRKLPKNTKRNRILRCAPPKINPKNEIAIPRGPFIWLRFRAPIRARFWREWAEQPNRTRGDLLSCRLGTRFAALCLTLQPCPSPTPMYTQLHPRTPNHPRIGRGSPNCPKHKTQRNPPLRHDPALAEYQLLMTKYGSSFSSPF